MSISVIAIELTLPNVCHQILHSQVKSQLLPASPGGSPRSASRSDPGSFKLLPLCWYLENVRFCIHTENAGSALVPPRVFNYGIPFPLVFRLFSLMLALYMWEEGSSGFPFSTTLASPENL